MSDSQPFDSQDSTATLTESRSEVLYFAFGSNLSTVQMLQRCPSSVPIGLGFLPGWRWIINDRGYANIIPRSQLSSPFWEAFKESTGLRPLGGEEDGVYGLLYLLPSQDEEALDVCEGVPWAYGKMVMDVERIGDENGRKVEGQGCSALCYVDEQRVQGNRAKEEYKERMERGIREAIGDWGLDEGYAQRMREWLKF